MKFFNDAGKMALGTRVRFLSDMIGADAARIYEAYNTRLHPKWFPVFYALSQNTANTVTSIAEYIGHSHVSAGKILSEMAQAGLVTEKTDPKDRRKTRLVLSKKGAQVHQKMQAQYTDVHAAIEALSSQATHDLWAALEEWEYLLRQKPLRERILEKKKQRESLDVKIVPYQPKYKEAFRKLNEEWIRKYFKLEEPDRVSLNNPKGYILDRGGFIFVALADKKPVGVCALIKRDDLDAYELAKMAVSPQAQGKNIGYLLGQAAIDKAKSFRARRLFLESNTILTPAIRLYEKLGFVKIVGPPTPYERCNIQMELLL